MDTPNTPVVKVTLALDALRLDPALQMRLRLDELKVREYAERMRAGDVFPPILVFADPDTREHLVVDGFHRWHAAHAARRGEIEAEVHPGTRREALLLAVGLNASHGLPRTNADKRKAVNVLFDDPEWSRWSDGEIARRCGVSQPFVSRQRGEWRARKCAAQRAEFRAEASTHNGYELREPAEVSQPRRFRRGGREHTMNTGQIGKTRARELGRTNGTPADADRAGTPTSLEGEAALQIAAAFAAAGPDLPPVQLGTWWRLGSQHLYRGPADGAFRHHLPLSPLALCDARSLTPGTAGAGATRHDWLFGHAEIVAVLLDNVDLLSFGSGTRMTYRYTVAVLTPADATGEETWQPVALFGAPETAITIPPVLRVGVDTDSGAASSALLLQLFHHLTAAGAPVIVPELGAGTGLLAAEATGRVCWGAEADPARCGRIIRAWEALTGETAVPAPVLRPARAA